MTQVPDSRSLGGVHPDPAALQDLLAHAGGAAPHTGRRSAETAILPLGEREALALLEALRGRLVELIGAERAAIDSLAKAAA